MAPNPGHSLTIDHNPHADVWAARTIRELLTLVPFPYRARAGELVNKVYRAYIEANQIRLYLAILQQHKTAGTFPPEIQKSIKDPALQFSKEYKASEDYAKRKAEMAAITLTYKRRALESFISMKELELKFFRERFSDVTYKAEMRAILLEVTQDILRNCGVDLHADGSVDKQTMPDFIVLSYVEFDELKDLYVERALSIASGFTQTKALQKMTSLTYKTDGDSNA